MEFLSENYAIYPATAVLGLILLVVAFVKRRYAYWERKGVPHIEPRFPWGNAGDLLAQKKSFGQTFNDVYLKMKSKSAKHAGYYFLLTPQYIPIDPELIKNILQKDFHYFVDRGVYTNERDEPLNVNLFTMEGDKWKNLRSKLSPTFTSGKMKMMFPLVVDACLELVKVIDESSERGPVEMKDLLGRLTTDIIGTCAFGIECNSLRNPDSEFSKYGRLIFVLSTWQRITGFFAFALPTLMKALRVTLLRKDVHDFFMGMIRETVTYRESNHVRRNDFIHLLLQIKNRGKLEDDETGPHTTDAKSLSIDEIAGQAFIFFMAGFETSSATMSFCLYELASNETIQKKLREEIDRVFEKHGGHLTYEALSEMPYMDMVVSETLRKHPSLPVLNRICTKDYKLPNSDTVLDRGIQVLIPVEGLHYDPEYYPNPEVFDPDRFTEENKRKRHPFTYLPFGEGPRVCVGMRFGMMQTKAGLALLLRNYRFGLSPKTARPLRIDLTKFLRFVVGGVWMNISKVNDDRM